MDKNDTIPVTDNYKFLLMNNEHQLNELIYRENMQDIARWLDILIQSTMVNCAQVVSKEEYGAIKYDKPEAVLRNLYFIKR